MSQKTTPDKRYKRNNVDPRNPNFEEESRPARPCMGRSSQHRDASTTAVVRPTRIHQTGRIYQRYPPVYSIAFPPPMHVAPPVMAPYPFRPPIMNRYTYRDTRWNTIIPRMPRQNLMYSVPITGLPMPIYTPMASQVCPYAAMLRSPVVTEPPMAMFSSQPPMHTLSPEAASTAHVDRLNQSFDSAYHEPTGSAPTAADTSYNSIDEMIQKLKISPVLEPKQTKPLDPDSYLMLPRELFPRAITLPIDPNPIIHELCLVSDFENISSWILDLEFGVPRQPVTRPIAIYDARSNSIHCKNTPGAIHPGFENCSEQFKNVFMFYYDTAISTWYKGFIITNSDKSVTNFQSWLQVPMQIYGMCWP